MRQVPSYSQTLRLRQSLVKYFKEGLLRAGFARAHSIQQHTDVMELALEFRSQAEYP